MASQNRLNDEFQIGSDSFIDKPQCESDIGEDEARLMVPGAACPQPNFNFKF